MEVIPAVDIMKGKVVRLRRGDARFAKSYEHLGGPLVLAKRWESEGAKIIHVVDLDAALGRGNNIEVIEDIVKTVNAHVQVGGGIRSLSSARDLLNKDIKRIILGSLAFREPSAVETLIGEFGANRVAVALDHLDGTVMVQGWKTSTEVSVVEAVKEFSRLGVNIFLVTSVARDGTMAGPDFETLAKVCGRGARVIAAGGIASLDDLVALKHLGVQGVVVGKALYEGMFRLGEALRTVKEGGV